jgi:hypothetical protein
MIELQTLFSRCDNEETSRIIQELFQTIYRLNTEIKNLKIMELNNEYLKALPIFARKLQLLGIKHHY